MECAGAAQLESPLGWRLLPMDHWAAQLESSLGWRLLASSAFGECVPRGARRVSWTEAAQLESSLGWRHRGGGES